MRKDSVVEILIRPLRNHGMRGGGSNGILHGGGMFSNIKPTKAIMKDQDMIYGEFWIHTY